MLFTDRVEAGKMLAAALTDFAGGATIVLAIPRGGVVLGYEIAKELRHPLDVIVPRKLGAPSNPELAIGAVTEDGIVMLDQRLVAYLGVSERYIEEECERQRLEITRRLHRYRGDAPYPNLAGRTVILVDDGIATGATVRAALASIRKKDPTSIVLAVPVAPLSTMRELEDDADHVVCLQTPHPFYAIGQFYRDFPQTSDEEVIRLLQRNREEIQNP
jgi:predicted phosphoribosyltransferase